MEASSQAGNPNVNQKADLGILFVHGIGEQKKSETLIAFGEPIIHWLNSWIRGADSNSETDPVIIVDSILNSGADKDEPSYSRLRIESANNVDDWLIAESWWAESFTAPTYRDLLNWAMIVLPFTVATHFYRRVRLAVKNEDEGARRLSRKEKIFQCFLEVIMAIFFVAILPIIGMMVVLVLALGVLPIPKLRAWMLAAQSKLLGTVGDSYILLGSEIRRGAMVSRVVRDIEWLNQRCKEVVLVAHSQGAAISLEALQVFPRDITGKPVNMFITLGAGIRKLKYLKNVSIGQTIGAWAISLSIIVFSLLLWDVVNWLWEGPPSGEALAVKMHFTSTEVLGVNLREVLGIDFFYAWWVFPVAIGVVMTIVGSIIVMIATRKIFSIENIIITFVLFITFTLFITIIQLVKLASGGLFFILYLLLITAYLYWIGKKDSGIDKSLDPGYSIPWFDFYASSDPIPNGPMLDNKNRSVVNSEPVENLSSYIGDHTSYWRNVDQFVSAVMRCIKNTLNTNSVTITETDTKILDRACVRRRWRMKWLRVGRIVTLACVILPLISLRDVLLPETAPVPSLFESLASQIVKLVSKVPLVLSDMATIDSATLINSVAHGFWWVIFALVAWVLLAVYRRAWSWWEAFDTNTLFARQDYLLLPLPALLLAVLLLLYGITSAYVLPYWDEIVDTVWTDPIVVDLKRYVMTGEIPNSIFQQSVSLVMSVWCALITAIGSAILIDLGNKFGSTREQKSELNFIDYVDFSSLVLKYLLALQVTVPVMYLAIGHSYFMLILFMFLSILAALGFLSLASQLYRLIPTAGISRLVSLTGAGSVALWDIAQGSDIGQIQAAVRQQLSIATPGGENPPADLLMQKLENKRVTTFLLGDLADKDSRDLLQRYAKKFPYAAMELVKHRDMLDSATMVEILREHRFSRSLIIMWSIRRALKTIEESA